MVTVPPAESVRVRVSSSPSASVSDTVRLALVVSLPLLISARAMVTVPPAESVRVRVSSSPSASVSDTVRLALVVSLPLLIDESATDSDVPSESVSVKESSVPSESVSVTAKVELVTPPAPQTVSPAALVVKTCPSLPAPFLAIRLPYS